MEQVIHPIVIHGTLWLPKLIGVLGIRILWVWDENTSIMDEFDTHGTHALFGYIS